MSTENHATSEPATRALPRGPRTLPRGPRTGKALLLAWRRLRGDDAPADRRTASGPRRGCDPAPHGGSGADRTVGFDGAHLLRRGHGGRRPAGDLPHRGRSDVSTHIR